MENIAKENEFLTADEYFDEIKNTDGFTELIGGEIVNMPSPSILHQKLSMRLSTVIFNYISAQNGRCDVFTSPTAVKLDEYNVVIPDIFVACNSEKFDSQKYNGAPDLVIEIVSTNRVDDFIRKLYLYQKSGVREYWIVDPKLQKTTVYFFEEDYSAETYRFDEPIDINIYKNSAVKLTVNIAEQLKR